MAHAASPSPRLLKAWGDEAVIYDTASGDTHYLKPLTLALYQICQAHPGATSVELAQTLVSRFGFVDTPELLELTEDTLQQLRKIHLLETA